MCTRGDETGSMWLEGDNLAASRDSNEFGPVPMALFKGRISAVVWPPQNARFIDRKYLTDRTMLPLAESFINPTTAQTKP